MANSENTITSAFVNVLRPMRHAWRVDEQITKPFLNATQRPDVIVTETGRNPIVIEVKIDGNSPNLTGMTQAEAHLECCLIPVFFLVSLTIPLRMSCESGCLHDSKLCHKEILKMKCKRQKTLHTC